MKDRRAGLQTDPDGRRYFRSRHVEFRTIDISAEQIHGVWLKYESPLAPLDWISRPEYRDIREFARKSSERLLDFWYRVLEVAIARCLALRETSILRVPLFKSDSFFDIGIPDSQQHSTIPPALHEKILKEYNQSKDLPTIPPAHYVGGYLEHLTDDIIARLSPYHRVWDLRAKKLELATSIDLLTSPDDPENKRMPAVLAQSVVFHCARAHRIRLRMLYVKRHARRATAGLSEALERSADEMKKRWEALSATEDPATTLAAAYLRANSELESIYLTEVDPFGERTAVRGACSEILARLRPLRRSTTGYSLNPGDKHGAMSLNPVIRLWKEKPNPRRPESRILELEINTRQTIECLWKLSLLGDPALSKRELNRGAIAKAMRGSESLDNMKVFLLPGSVYPLREIHPLDFPEFRARVIGESRSPAELGASEPSVLTGAWFSKRQHAMYVTVGADNGQLLRILWDSGRSPGPPAFFFALGQFVHDCLDDSLIYRKTSGITFRECVEDYYDFEDRIRKNRDEKTGRRRIDNSRTGVRFMFAVLYSRLITEILTGSFQSQFRHPATEKWMEANLGLTKDRQRLRNVRIKLRKIIQGYDGFYSSDEKNEND